ncbi:MAG: SLC13/DASS family transporter [Cryomorphaceae bacterium]|nr:SLC13/DASS family transporter [Cryomorphaceae bacterium]
MKLTVQSAFYFHRLAGVAGASVLWTLGYLVFPDFLNELLVLGMMFWMLYWWISGAVSLGVTSLIPLIFLPISGIFTLQETSDKYANPIIFLFLGGFMLAIALEKYSLHQYAANQIVKVLGTSLRARVRSILFSSAILSMWISNTATALIMLPIAMNFSQQAGMAFGKNHVFHKKVFLSIAAGANIGGIATLVGTPPNLFFSAFIQQETGITIDFFKWMIIGVPVAALLLFAAERLLIKGLTTKMTLDEKVIYLKLDQNQKIVLSVFGLVALFWMAKPLFALIFAPLGQLHDAVIALAGVVLLSLIPQKGKSQPLIEWPDLKQLPWDIVLLFGAGLSLAGALQSAGVFSLLEESFHLINNLNLWIIVLIFACIGIFLTEAMSNIAMIAVLLPYVYEITSRNGLDFPTIAIPMVIGASCAFMLPISTPPNAIVFGSGALKVKDMVHFGFRLNIFAMLIITVICMLFLEGFGLFAQLR